MIKKLNLHNIGPAPDLEAEFGERLNVITGDNGLGKTFLLDACWYALTKRTWAEGREFYPASKTGKADPPRIEYTLVGASGKPAASQVVFNFQTQSWQGKEGRPAMPGLVVYARIDGGFSVWDPAQHYWMEEDDDGESSSETRETLEAFQFSKAQVWNGLPEGAARIEDIICNGLLRDVENWRLKGNGVFDLFQQVLKHLSSGDGEMLKIGAQSVTVGRSLVEIPTLVMPYGEIPITQAAAGMKRVLALAYLLVWAWETHKKASLNKRAEPTKRMVLLFDEVEAHLHPKWQKVLLPAVLKTVESLLLMDHAESVQIIATTHAPLVLGSVETLWDKTKDQLFDFDLAEGQVSLEAIEFFKHGSAENWLGSDSFDLPADYPGYSLQAQKAMRRADAFMIENSDPRGFAGEMESIHEELQRTLGNDDEYWPYWLPYFDKRKDAA
ncbi:MAG: hypothetical protein B7Z37_19295 [Verrucomicrobia bacterium 12-59-8]|nr:MAG: hypothetical protein B7Z37_19295 [Verrucomicrobia bacterium 12-59-8]